MIFVQKYINSLFSFYHFPIISQKIDFFKTNASNFFFNLHIKQENRLSKTQIKSFAFPVG